MNRKTIFWSIYLILVGLLLLVKLLFNLHFGWFSAAFAILLLQSGIALIVWGCTNGKKSYRHEGGLHMFMSGTILPDPSDETVTVFFADARVELSAPCPRRWRSPASSPTPSSSCRLPGRCGPSVRWPLATCKRRKAPYPGLAIG